MIIYYLRMLIAIPLKEWITAMSLSLQMQNDCIRIRGYEKIANSFLNKLICFETPHLLQYSNFHGQKQDILTYVGRNLVAYKKR
jgi:hypothetical protein